MITYIRARPKTAGRAGAVNRANVCSVQIDAFAQPVKAAKHSILVIYFNTLVDSTSFKPFCKYYAIFTGALINDIKILCTTQIRLYSFFVILARTR
jgi:hypothetical protein